MKKNLSRIFSLFLTAAVLAGSFLPVTASAIDQMQVAASAAILVDADHGDVLFEQNDHDKHYPASITKVMTALLTLEAVDRGNLSLDTAVTAQASAFEGLSADGSTQNIKAGEQLTVLQLLECALIPSANEACNILAEEVSGSISSFVDLMNKRAAELGMKDTHFANPNGLQDENHYTTAYDISLMVMQALKNETFRKIVGTSECRIPATNLSAERHFYNTNALLSNWHYAGYTYSNAIGVKTGSTPEAGLCLASAAVENGRTLVAVVLGAQSVTKPDGTVDRQSFSESKRLLQWGFANFTRKTLLDSTSLLGEVKVTLSKEASHVVVHPDGTLEATLPKDVNVSDFQEELHLNSDSVEAPVEQGQVLGTVTMTYQGKSYGTVNVVAANSVSRSALLYNIARVKAFFGLLWVRLALILLLVFALFLLVRRLVMGRGGRKRRRGSRYGGSYNGGGYSGRSRWKR